MKASRTQYKRNWAAATRNLKSINSNIAESDSESDNNDTTNFSLYAALPEHTDNETAQEQPQPVPKRTCLEGISVDTESTEIDLHVMQQNVSFSSDSEDDYLKDEIIENELASWANKFQIKQNALDSLLAILQNNGHPNLPSSSRTLLKTVRSIPLQTKSGMQYVYFPIAAELSKYFGKYPAATAQVTDHLEISLNVDGLPLFKSSRQSLWPVLCAIVNLQPVTVFPVALTYGISKPQNLEFLEDLIRDLGHVLQHGLKDGDKTLAVSLRCVVCDAPAKALIKSTKLYSGYSGCDKCSQKGLWIGRMTYPETQNFELRNDSTFREQVNKEHHHNTSPFCNLQIDMVKKFPIDYMHQLCLGVMKKLLLMWIRGKRDVKISAGQVEEISLKLTGLKPCIPSQFARKPRGLAEIDRWKATEFRQFLLYTGKIVLNGILRTDLYEHFMCLSIASCVLISPTLAQTHRQYAHELLVYFVGQAAILYGSEFLVYNVHSMVHLAAEVEEYGSLDACSAFPFENYMQKLKRMVRSGRNPLTQIVKRLSEVSASKDPETKHAQSVIKIKKPNNAYILTNSSCCEVIDKTDHHDEIGNQLYMCRVYERTEPLFNNPCDSRLVDVHKGNQRWTTVKMLSAQCLHKKAIMVDLEHNKIVFMAILHSI